MKTKNANLNNKKRAFFKTKELVLQQTRSEKRPTIFSFWGWCHEKKVKENWTPYRTKEWAKERAFFHQIRFTFALGCLGCARLICKLFDAHFFSERKTLSQLLVFFSLFFSSLYARLKKKMFYISHLIG